MKNLLRALSVGLFAFLLGSCIEFEQEIDLNSDGSGEFEIVLRAPDMGNDSEPEAIMTDEEAEAQAEASGVEILDNSVSKANGKVTTKLRVAFNDIDELNAFMTEENEGEDMNFQFSLEKDGGETTLRHRVIPEEEDSDESEEGDEMGELMMANMFKDSYYIIRWSLPSDVIRATDGATIDGKSVEFKVPMTALMNNSGVDVSATYKSGTPVWIYFALGGVVLLLVLVVLPKMFKKS